VPRPSSEADLIETRPEPVVKRASIRPPAAPEPSKAPDPIKTEPLPRAEVRTLLHESRPVLVPPCVMIDVESRPNVTPFLGTRVSAVVSPLPPRAWVTEDDSSGSETPTHGTESNGVAEAPGFVPVSEAVEAREDAEPSGVVPAIEAAVASEIGSDEVHAGSADDGDCTIVELPSDDLIEAVLSPAAPVVSCAAPDFVDDGDVEIIEVIFDPSASSGVLADAGLLFSEASDLTEPCPPIEEAGELDVVTPSANVATLSVEAVYVAALEADALSVETDAPYAEAAAPSVETDAPHTEAAAPSVETDVPYAEAAAPSVETAVAVSEVAPPSVDVDAPRLEVAPPQPEGESPSVEAPPPDVAEFSLLVAESEIESALPPWALVAPEVHEITPPPRVALRERPPSDVDELLLRLDEIPLPLDDLQAGLRRLAGLELTPEPPRLAFER
jgi:hypothetical protein